jgi:hypothetical protein
MDTDISKMEVSVSLLLSEIIFISELSSVGLERCLDRAEVIGSNPIASIFSPTLSFH